MSLCARFWPFLGSRETREINLCWGDQDCVCVLRFGCFWGGWETNLCWGPLLGGFFLPFLGSRKIPGDKPVLGPTASAAEVSLGYACYDRDFWSSLTSDPFFSFCK